ncbi:cytochrome b [Jannaschia sp. LMIT008]|uniref:cytochrome b n=1 Tax=Jannaschia maritima TaxID=3032585 RepID=UPI002811CC9E|nr:cytochrome b/b6 domain-containing protein [Jannaschia sp. LMIT008]
MAQAARPVGAYHVRHIAMHWTVVFLVLFQYATGGRMEQAYLYGVEYGVLPMDGVLYVHGIIGTCILIAMLVRLYLRLKHGAPPPPDNEPKPIQILSRATHFAFYGLLIAMPLFGMAALWVKAGWLGQVHGIAAYVVLGLAVLHVAGAMWHAIKRDGVVSRMGGGTTVTRTTT